MFIDKSRPSPTVVHLWAVGLYSTESCSDRIWIQLEWQHPLATVPSSVTDKTAVLLPAELGM
jgi:hypothetical protein